MKEQEYFNESSIQDTRCRNNNILNENYISSTTNELLSMLSDRMSIVSASDDAYEALTMDILSESMLCPKVIQTKMDEPADESTNMASVKEEPAHLKNFEIDAEMESMLENLEDLMFEFDGVDANPLEEEEDSDEDCVMIEDENEDADSDKENDDEEEEEEEYEEEQEEEDNEEEGEEEADTVEDNNEEVDYYENVSEEDETVEDENDEEKAREEEECSEGETPLVINTEGESKTEEVEKKEQKIYVENKDYGDQNIQSFGDSKVESGTSLCKISERKSKVEVDEQSKIDKFSSQINNVKESKVEKKSTEKGFDETENSSKDCEPSSTFPDDKTSSTLDKKRSFNQVNNKKKSLLNEETDKRSHISTKNSTGNTKPEKMSFQKELEKMMDQCDTSVKADGDKTHVSGAEISEMKDRKPVAKDYFKSDFGVQTSFVMPTLNEQEWDGTLTNVLDDAFDKNFESGECTSSDDEEAVNALREDKMFNHKIDNMMNNFEEIGKRRDMSSIPTAQNDKEKLCNSKKKDVIIKLLYKKMKSVGENKIVEEMLSKKLIDEQSKEKLLEIIRYCVENRKEKKRLKKLKKRAHLLKVTKNNTYLETLKQKTELVLATHQAKTPKHNPIIVDSKITKRVIVDCNTVDLKSKTIDDDDLRLLIKRKQLAKHRDSSLLLRGRKLHKKSSNCKKKEDHIKKKRSKEERKLRKSERQRRKIELLLKRREKLKHQYREAMRRNSENTISSTSSHDIDAERKKKIDLENIIKEKIALVFVKRDLKQAEVSSGEVVAKTVTRQDTEKFQSSREGGYSSDSSKKSTVTSSHSSKAIVKGPAADSFSELYQELEKKPAAKQPSVVKEAAKVVNEINDDGEMFPTISSIICEDMDLDSDYTVPSPPPPPIISEVDEEKLEAVHVSRTDQHEQALKSDSTEFRSRRVVSKVIVPEEPASPLVSSVAVKQRAPPRRRSRSPVRNNQVKEEKDWRKKKSRSRSRSPKHRKTRSPVTKKPEAIAARRRSPSPKDWYGRNRTRPAEPASKLARSREPPNPLWRRRSRSRSRSRERERKSSHYSPPPRTAPKSALPPKSPPRNSNSRLSEIRKRQKEEFEEAIRKWREAQDKNKPEITHTSQSHMSPAQMMSPYHMSVPETQVSQYGSPGMIAHPSAQPEIAYHNHDIQQTSSANTTGQQVTTNSTTMDNGVSQIGQSSGGTATTIIENESSIVDSSQLLASGIGKATHCHHHSAIPDSAQTQHSAFNNSAEGFPYFNPQSNTGFPINVANMPVQSEMDSVGVSSDDHPPMPGFPRFPPPGHPPFKVVHHPQFPYPIPVPYIEPPQSASPLLHQAPIIPFIRPPPNLCQPPPTNEPPPLLNPPPLPLTDPPPLINPPLPPSPAPSTICSSPIRPSSPAVSECDSIRSSSSRKKIGRDLNTMIEFIKGKFDQGEQPTEICESPSSGRTTPRRNKSFQVKDLKDLISTVRKNIAHKKSDKSSEKVSSTEDQDKSPSSTPQKLKIEFKKPVVKNLIRVEIAPEFLKEMQEEEEADLPVINSDKPVKASKETSDTKDDSNKSDEILSAESKDTTIKSNKDSRSEDGKLKSKTMDKEALRQKKMKMLEILSGLSTKISKNHKSSSSIDEKADDDEEKSQKKTGEQITAETSSSSKLIPSRCTTKLQNESNSVSRSTSSESKSDTLFDKAENIFDDKREITPLQKRMSDCKSMPSPVAAETERRGLIKVHVVSGNKPSVKVQESIETPSPICIKDSVDQKIEGERKCHDKSTKNDRESQKKIELDKQATSLYKRRSRFSDVAPHEHVDSTRESYHRPENKCRSESILPNKTVIEKVQHMSVPMPLRVTENRVGSETDSLEKSATKTGLSASDNCKTNEDNQNRTLKTDQQVDSGKPESPPNKISREEIQKRLKIELAQVKAACKASSGDISKNSACTNNQESTHEKLSGTKASKMALKYVEPVNVSKSDSSSSLNSVLKNVPNSESSQLKSCSKNSTVDVTAVPKTDFLMNKEPQVSQKIMSSPNTSHNNSTAAPKAKIPLSDPRLDRPHDVEVSKNIKESSTPLSDPRLNRTHNLEVNKNVEVSQTSFVDPRVNRAHNVEVGKNVEVSQTSLVDPRVNRAHNVEVGKSVEVSQTSLVDPRVNRAHNVEVEKNVEVSQTSLVDPRVNRALHVEDGKNVEISQTSLSDPRLNRARNAEVSKNVEMLQAPFSDPRLNRTHGMEVDRNLEISQRPQQTSEIKQLKRSYSDVPPKKATLKPNLKSLTLRVMNEFDPVILRESLGSTEGCPEGERLEFNEIEGDSFSSTKEKYTENKPTSADRPLQYNRSDSEKSGSLNLNRCSEHISDVQNPKLKPPIESHKPGDSKLKLSPTRHIEQSETSQKGGQVYSKGQSQLLLGEQSGNSHNNAQLNKKMHSQDQSNQVKEIYKKPVKDDSSRPLKDRCSSLEISSNKEKTHPVSNKNEQSLSVNKDRKLNSTNDKKDTPLSKSGSIQTSKPKSTIANSMNNSETKVLGSSNSKKTEGLTSVSSGKVVPSNKDRNVSKIHNQVNSKSPLPAKVDNSKLQKDKKNDTLEISNEEHSKIIVKNRRSSYEPVSSTTMQKNNCPSSDNTSKLRRASLDLLPEKDKKMVETKSCVNKDLSAKKSCSTSLEKTSLKSLNTKSIDLKRTENNIRNVNEDKRGDGRKLKLAEHQDKTQLEPSTKPSSSKYVISNLSNREITNMEPPKVQERRNSVIEISSSDDESVKMSAPVSRKSNESSRDAIKKPAEFKKMKHKRSNVDAVLPSSNVELAESNRDPRLKKKKSSSTVRKEIGLIEKKKISEVDELKRLLESDSSDEEFEPKKKKAVLSENPKIYVSSKKDDSGTVLENATIKKAVMSKNPNENATTRIDDREKFLENVPLKKLFEKEKCIEKVATKEIEEIDESKENVTNKKAVESKKPQGNVASKKFNKIEKSNENVTNRKVQCSTSKEIVTTEKVEIEKVTATKTDSVKKIGKIETFLNNCKIPTTKEDEFVKNVEETGSSTTEGKNITELDSKSPLPIQVNKNEEKENLSQNLIDNKSLESNAEICKDETKMKELTLSNEDFNFDVDSPKDVKSGPNTRKTKKLDKSGKLKNKFLKIGDDLFPDQESNESSDSFKTLITNICGTLEENNDSPAVFELDVGIKTSEDASLVVAESLKLLGSFVAVAKSVFRERKNICVHNFVVDEEVNLIQHITDIKKTKCQKGKTNRSLQTIRMERDGCDNNSIVSSDSFDVFEFSEDQDLPSTINDKRSLIASSTETIRSSKPQLNELEIENNKTSTETIPSSKPQLNELETENNKTVKKDFSAQCTSSDILDNSSPALETNEPEINSDGIESTCVETTKVLAQNVYNIESSGEEIVGEKIGDKSSGDEIISQKCVDETLSQNLDEMERLGEKVTSKKGTNTFIITTSADAIISTKRDDEISSQNANNIESSGDKIVGTSCGSFLVNTGSTAQQVDEANTKSATRSTSLSASQKLQARYKASPNAFTISIAGSLINRIDKSIKRLGKWKSSQAASLNDDVKKFCASNELNDDQEQKNETYSPALESEMENCDDVIEKSVPTTTNSSSSKANKRAKINASLIEDESVPKKKRKLRTRLAKKEDGTSNFIEKDIEDINTRVTRARKSVGTTMNLEEAEDETSNVIGEEVEDMNTRVTRARKSVGFTNMNSEEVEDETSNVIGEEVEDMNTRVTRARKSVGFTPMNLEEVEDETSNGIEEVEDMNTRVTRARKSLGLTVRFEDIEGKSSNEDPMENLVGDHDTNSCERESRDSRNETGKEEVTQLEEGKSKKKLRSSVKMTNKEEEDKKCTPNEDELLWNRICQGFKSSRAVGTNVSKVRGRLMGFESFESTEKATNEMNLDDVIASLMRLKQLRESQKL